MVAGLAILGIALATLHPRQPTLAIAETPLWCLVCGEQGTVDVVLNVLLFIPLGFSLAWGQPIARAVLVGFGLSTVIELAQLTIIGGRDASLGDLLSNTLGTGLGALASARWRVLIRPGRKTARRLVMAAAIGWIVMEAGTAWSLRPVFPETQFSTQFAPALAEWDVFEGQVLSATLGERPLSPGIMVESRIVHQRLTDGSPLHAIVRLGDQPGNLAPVVQLVDGRQRSLVLLGQHRSALVFRVRMRATAMRLRTPEAILDQSLSHRGDSLRLTGALTNGRFHLAVEGENQRTSYTVALSPSWGWALLDPFQIPIDPEARVMTALWLLVLLVPIGYWGRAARWLPWQSTGAAGLLVAAGLWLVPYLSGFETSHLSEWLSAVGGIAAGWGWSVLMDRTLPRAPS